MLNLRLVPTKDPNANYYEQFCQLSIANIVMQFQIKKLLAERQDMYLRLRMQRKDEEGKIRGEDESLASSGAIPMGLSGLALQQRQVNYANAI